MFISCCQPSCTLSSSYFAIPSKHCRCTICNRYRSGQKIVETSYFFVLLVHFRG
ncbi:hypothetical protein BDQ17DRAFT_1359256 [Cyathus striatus]|nr:hypothetical protein BDQ17DRAFT_1359256 [Cyathus striatus]